MDLEEIPLGPEDRAILDLEGETVAGHTCKVIRIGAGAPDIEALRESVARRLPGLPELTWRLGGSEMAPTWIPAGELDMTEHVRAAERAEPLGEAEIAARTADLFEQRLDRTRPLWQIHVPPTEDGGAVLIWRIHHALADGTTAMRFARELLWDEEPAAPRSVPASGSERRQAPSGEDDAGDHKRRRRHLGNFIEREFGESLRRSPFDGRIGTRRRIALASVELQPLHDAAKERAGATLNDAVLSIVTGSLRHWLEHHHGSLRGVRVRVPVSLHHEGDTSGNLDSFFSLPLPLGEADPVRRLEAVRAATSARKADHDAEHLQEMMQALGSRSARLQAFCGRLEASPRSFALSVSNVPGPRTPVSVLGAPVESIHSIAEIGSRHALRVAVVSLAGRLNFGLCADPVLVDDLDAMARGLEAEAESLVAAS